MAKTMTDLNGKRYVFTIVDTETAPDGGYIPCVAIEGETGYHPMNGVGRYASPWNWGRNRDIAQQLCEERNDHMGYTREEAIKIVLGTMPFGKGGYSNG